MMNDNKKTAVREMPLFPNEYGYEDEEEQLEPTRPLSAERQAEIDELYAQLAVYIAAINGEVN